MANLRRSRTGRRLIAVRTNERAAASLGISVVGVKLYAFAVAAGIAAVAGILTAFQFQVIQYGQFNVFASINYVGFAVIGGIGFVLGAVFAAPNALGGLGTKLLEDTVDLGDWTEVAGAALVIVILLVHQNGIADVVTHVVRPAARRLRLLAAARPVELPEAEPEPVPPATLSVEGLTVRFGSVVAVHDVSFEVRPGEVVGLIGPNGAGKTTVIDAVTGFVKPAAGTIGFDGQEVAAAERHPAGGPGPAPVVPVAGAVRRPRRRGQHPRRGRAGRGQGVVGERPGLARPPRPQPDGGRRHPGLRPRGRPRLAARGAAVRAAPPGRHRPGGGVRALDRDARRAGRRPRRGREPRAGRPHPGPGPTSGGWASSSSSTTCRW